MKLLMIILNILLGIMFTAYFVALYIDLMLAFKLCVFTVIVALVRHLLLLYQGKL